MTETTILETTTADGPMAIVCAAPTSDPIGRIVIFQDAPGIRPSLHAFASTLAEAGYEVALPDLWHRHGRLIGYEAADMAADPSKRAHLGELLATFDDDQVRMDFDAAVAAKGWEQEPLAVIGFCMGARSVHRALTDRPDQVVAGAMWHPSFLADDSDSSPHVTAAGLGQPLYIGIGDADQVQSLAMHKRYLDAVADLDHVQLHVFAGADHGFTWPTSPNYHEEAATTSFAETTRIFGAAFEA